MKPEDRRNDVENGQKVMKMMTMMVVSVMILIDYGNEGGNSDDID